MTVRVGINGFGRIGRNFYRALTAQGADVEIVGVNDLTDNATLAHLLKYDSILGRFPAEVTYTDDAIVVGGTKIATLAERDPAKLPWGDLGADVVIESTGYFTDADQARAHVDGGAKKVIISAPAKNEDVTVVLGVNEGAYDRGAHRRLDGLLHDQLPRPDDQGAARGLRHRARDDDHDPRVHNDQVILDFPHKDLRRARAAALNMIPTTTGAAKAIGLVMPELKGKLDGFSMRVPVPTGSATDLTVRLSRPATKDEINAAFRAAADGPFAGLVEYTEDPIVSTDIVTNPASCIFDSSMTNVIADSAKVLGWYDNEWGYSNRLVDFVGYVGARL